uniref:Uncharacterized protein n=1 Tax=Romanomermis culicivorax TaxID=13658 RepID=A0A915K4B0_ROMCU
MMQKFFWSIFAAAGAEKALRGCIHFAYKSTQNWFIQCLSYQTFWGKFFEKGGKYMDGTAKDILVHLRVFFRPKVGLDSNDAEVENEGEGY